jgi:hypothetical protein
MGKLRFSIAGLMGIVLVAAVGMASLRNASEIWAGAMVLMTCGILALSAVGVFCGSRSGRPWWLGFCAFGGTYMVLSGCWSTSSLTRLPTTDVLEYLGPSMGIPLREVIVPMCCTPRLVLDQSYVQAGQCFSTLLAGLLGGLLAQFSFALPPDPDEGREADSNPTDRPPRIRWIRPTVAGMVVLVPLASIATIVSLSNAVFWAGAALLSTCALIGLAGLAAVFRRGRHRASALGAALFGAGCLIPVFGRPADPSSLPDRLINGFRPWLPSMVRSIIPANARILEALEQPVPMRFPDEIPLGDLVKYISKATSTPTDAGIPIYVDPIGLQEAERSLNSTVQIDLEGLPLRTTLRLGLSQLGLKYVLEDGFLWIISDDSYEDLAGSPRIEDPLLIIGHCLLALVAAGFGAVLAPFVTAARREPSMLALAADRRPS